MKAKRKEKMRDRLRQHAFQNKLCDLQCTAYILIVSVKENCRYFFCIYRNHHTVTVNLWVHLSSVNLPPRPTPCNHSHHVLIILVVVERRGAVFTVTVNNHLLCITHFLILWLYLYCCSLKSWFCSKIQPPGTHTNSTALINCDTARYLWNLPES